MALFGGQRDVSLIKSLNRELVNRYIDIEIVLYKLNLQTTKTNIYNESNGKTYYEPARVNCLITRDARTSTGDDYGIDTARTGQFAFFRPDLEERNIVIEVGDIILHDANYYEVDNISYAQEYFAGKDETTDLGYIQSERSSFGLDVSIVVEAHITRMNMIQVEPVRTGINKPNQVPRNL
jgi:hypothetical protein